MAQFLVSIRELNITDRGVPIGRIVPMGHVPMGQDLDQRIAAMRETGLAHWSGRKLGKRKPVAKLRGRGSVGQLVVEDRD